MAPKTKLVLDLGLSDDFTLVGIACHVKDYRFCWMLNRQLEIKLRKLKDFLPEQARPGAEPFAYPLYYTDEEFRDENFYLLGNHCAGKDLVDKYTAVDYFLFIRDLAFPGGVRALLQEIKRIPQILTTFHIPLSDFRDAEYLLEGMEFTRMEDEKERLDNKLKLANLIGA
jgi:hypothetical protein